MPREIDLSARYTPTRKQDLYHSSNADELLYGGAAGGGKSAATVHEAGLLCCENPGLHVYLFRRTYPELQDSLIKEAYRQFHGVGRFVQSRHTWEFPNGSRMLFRHCQRESDRFAYQGAEINALFIDELTHFTRTIYDYLKTRVRAAADLHFVPRTRCTSNPGGVGHAWVKALYADLEPYKYHDFEVSSETTGGKKIVRRQYIPARVMDNPHLSADYIYELEQKPPTLRKALLEGSWDAFEGQVFFEWANDETHYADQLRTHVIAPFKIPAGWRRYRSFDWGYNKPFAVLWFAVDQDDRAYLYREWYGASAPDVGIKMPVQAVGAGILEREAQDGDVIGYADPSIWAATPDGESIEAQFENGGVYFLPGDNERLAGKQQLHNRLAFDDNDGRPMLQVFSTCHETIRTIPALVYSETRVEDVDTQGEDHIYDAMRYFLMMRPMGPRVTAEKKVAVHDPYDPLELRKKPRSGGFL